MLAHYLVAYSAVSTTRHAKVIDHTLFFWAGCWDQESKNTQLQPQCIDRTHFEPMELEP